MLNKLYNYLKANKENLNAFKLKKIAIVELDQKVLELHKIQPIQGLYKKLGEGSEGVVYLALFNGKPVAAKITYGQSILEVRKWQDILNLNLPLKYQKHLPKIYKIESNVGNDTIPPHQIIIMEILEPLSGKQLDVLFPDLERDNVYFERLNEIIKNEELLNATLNFALNQSNIENTDEIKKYLIKFFQNYSIPEINNNEKLSKTFRNDIFEYLVPLISETQNDELSLLLDSLFEDEDSSKQIEADKIAESIVNYTFQQQFPYGYSMWNDKSNVEYFLHHPASRELLETLLYIVNNTGIAWADVKPQNLMIRPSTGDVVIIDVGRYNKLHLK